MKTCSARLARCVLVEVLSGNEAREWTAVALRCVGQIYADLQHYVEIDLLAVGLRSYPASCYSVKCSTFHGLSRYPAPLL